MLTKKDLAIELNISERSIDRMIARGLPYYKTSNTNAGMTRFEYEEVKEWLRNNTIRED